MFNTKAKTVPRSDMSGYEHLNHVNSTFKASFYHIFRTHRSYFLLHWIQFKCNFFLINHACQSAVISFSCPINMVKNCCLMSLISTNRNFISCHLIKCTLIKLHYAYRVMIMKADFAKFCYIYRLADLLANRKENASSCNTTTLLRSIMRI